MIIEVNHKFSIYSLIFKVSDTFFIINEMWMSQWKDYLYSNKKFLKKNFIKGLPIPPPIDNKILLLDEENEQSKHEEIPIPNLKKVFKYFFKFYYINEGS